MKDSWCKTIMSNNGHLVSGGAARNIRIAELGGQEQIIKNVIEEVATLVLDRANKAARAKNLRIVARIK